MKENIEEVHEERSYNWHTVFLLFFFQNSDKIVELSLKLEFVVKKNVKKKTIPKDSSTTTNFLKNDKTVKIVVKNYKCRKNAEVLRMSRGRQKTID